MIVSVYNAGGKIVIPHSIVVSRNEHQFAYGISYSATFTVNVKVDIKIGEKYKVSFTDREPVSLILLSATKARDGNINYRFVHEVFYRIATNSYKNQHTALSVSFNDYILGMNNQLDYFIYEIRKKGLIIINDDDLTPAQVTISERLFSGEVKTTISESSFTPISTGGERKNYYTIKPVSRYFKTFRGSGFNHFKPFLSSSDIAGLNNYLVPTGLIHARPTKEFIGLSIGDLVKVKGKRCVVLETDIISVGSRTSLQAYVGERIA